MWYLLDAPFFILPSLISHMVSVEVNHHERRRRDLYRGQELCVNRQADLGSHSLLIPVFILPSLISHVASQCQWR